jgi:hypothetical protein
MSQPSSGGSRTRKQRQQTLIAKIKRAVEIHLIHLRILIKIVQGSITLIESESESQHDDSVETKTKTDKKNLQASFEDFYKFLEENVYGTSISRYITGDNLVNLRKEVNQSIKASNIIKDLEELKPVLANLSNKRTSNHSKKKRNKTTRNDYQQGQSPVLGMFLVVVGVAGIVLTLGFQ